MICRVDDYTFLNVIFFIPNACGSGSSKSSERHNRCERMKQGEYSSNLCELLAQVTERL